MRGLTPSVIAADFMRLGDQMRAVEPYAARWHVDVMDGHYVPNLTIGPLVFEAIAGSSALPQDAHLMIANPAETWQWYAKAGASRIAFHPDAVDDPGRLLSEIADAGYGRGLAINPDVPAQAVKPHLGNVDLLIVMMIAPGFSGQELRPELLPKLTALRRMVDDGGYGIDLVVDGGVNLETAPRCLEAGGNLLVSASAVFWSPDPGGTAKALRDMAVGEAR